MLPTELSWLLSRETLAWAAALSVLTIVGGMLLVPFLIVRMPADYFTRDRRAPSQHPVARGLWRALRNLVGAFLLVAGIAMLVLPGQGLLTMLAAVSLLDFPGKRRLERRMLRLRPLQRAINGLRRRAGKPPVSF